MKYNSTLTVLLVAIVCAGVALPSFAQTGEVYSLNVVGFQKLAATSAFTMVSTPFDHAPYTLDSVVGSQLAGGKGSAQADNILLWNKTNQAYETYYLWTNGQWYIAGGVVQATNVYLTPDMGFWVRNRRTTGQVVVVSGDVVDRTAVTNILVPGFNMVSYPFSTDTDINSCNLTNGKTGKGSAQADNLQLWNPSNQAYETYWLTTNRFWAAGGGVTAVTNIRVGGGRGFWYRNRNTVNFSWVEAKPYTL